jgi:hypothetical protein
LAKPTNSRSMRYACLDVRSPDVNFLRKVVSCSHHDGGAYSRHPCRQSADADIVSAFPLSFSTSRKYQHPPTNIFDMAPHTPGVLRFGKLSKKPVAPAGYKNKQCRVSYTLPRATGIISLTFKLISFTKVSCQNSFIVFS